MQLCEFHSQVEKIIIDKNIALQSNVYQPNKRRKQWWRRNNNNDDNNDNDTQLIQRDVFLCELNENQQIILGKFLRQNVYTNILPQSIIIMGSNLTYLMTSGISIQISNVNTIYYTIPIRFLIMYMIQLNYHYYLNHLLFSLYYITSSI